MTADDPIVVVDLFCGAGGFSTGAALALEELGRTPGEDVELHAINHWGVAIETHEANHPWAKHYHSTIDDVDPLAIAEPGEVELMVGGPECTHYSTARGGKPVSDQKREPAFNVLTWVQKLRPKNVLIENVEEFKKWGPIKDGQPSKDGTVFEAWVTALNALGYAVDHRVLNAADYGDPTSRKRLFIIARREARPSYPAPSHSDDPDDELEPWRTAAEIIDWSDPGTSLWTRDLKNNRVQPLSVNTMARIAEGIRRHCDPRLSPFADALEEIGPDELRRLRELVVPAEYAGLVADTNEAPFLVEAPARPIEASPFLTKYYGTNYATSVEAPLDTVTAGGNKYGLSGPEAYLLGQHNTNQARGVDHPSPTVTRVPRIALCSTSPYVLGQQSNSVARAVDERPMPTVVKGGKIHLVEPASFCLRQQSGGVPASVGDPLPTVSGGGAIALSNVSGRPLVMPKNGIHRGLHSNALYPPGEQPFHTITTDPRAKLIEPSLVRYSHGGAVLDFDNPMPTITAAKRGEYALASSYLCPMYNTFGADELPRTRSVDRPLMTVTARKPAPACLATPFLAPLYREREGQRPRTRTLDRPLMTVPASKSPAGIASPFLVEYYGESAACPVDVPTPTVTTKDRFALCVPEAWPWGLDVKYRMLKPSELKQAQGFPPDYELAGERKRDVTEQIGNAVPVNTAKALCKHLLDEAEPSLSNYGGGLAEDPEYQPPTYAEVAQSDG